MKANLKCWNECCQQHKSQGRILFEQLKERHEDKGHWDYVCPFCESVIICSEKRLK